MTSILRNFSRHVALDALSLVEAFRPVSATPKVHFILLHQVKDHETDRFEAFLDWLESNYRIVSYSEAVEQLMDADRAERVAAISFDDGFKNNLNAAEIMTRRGISGCFFVCPNIVGQTDPQVVDRYCRERMLFKTSIPFMSWDDLELLIETGHEIGNHSNHHFYMMELEDDEFIDEVVLARDELIRRLGGVEHFAWPYGRFFSFSQASR